MHIQVTLTPDEAVAHARDSILRSVEHNPGDTFDVSIATPDTGGRGYDKIKAIKLLRERIANRVGVIENIGFSSIAGEGSMSGFRMSLLQSKLLIEEIADIILRG